MKLKYGLISADSHAQLHKDAFTGRMSRARFGDRIPHVIETTDKSMMAQPSEHPVERWVVNGKGRIDLEAGAWEAGEASQGVVCDVMPHPNYWHTIANRECQ